jgi:hypothetical protein
MPSKRTKASPKRTKASPKRTKASPKRTKASPKRTKASPKLFEFFRGTARQRRQKELDKQNEERLNRFNRVNRRRAEAEARRELKYTDYPKNLKAIMIKKRADKIFKDKIKESRDRSYNKNEKKREELEYFEKDTKRLFSSLGLECKVGESIRFIGSSLKGEVGKIVSKDGDDCFVLLEGGTASFKANPDDFVYINKDLERRRYEGRDKKLYYSEVPWDIRKLKYPPYQSPTRGAPLTRSTSLRSPVPPPRSTSLQIPTRTVPSPPRSTSLRSPARTFNPPPPRSTSLQSTTRTFNPPLRSSL